MEESKWANFVITAVKYHPRRTAITEVEIRADNGAHLGPPQRATRQSVIDAIDRGQTFVTAYRQPDGNFRRGEDVRVVNTPHGRFIRTDRDNILADNISKLPEYA